ncbi:MAG: hypothetical protein IJX88_00395 [Clostridia bacterium]|nr:hypothetical protein [Clostridia bacterium]
MKRKSVSLFLFIIAVFFAVACGKVDSSVNPETVIASVEKTTEDLVVIKVDTAGDCEYLVDIMAYLQDKEALTFTTDGAGMVSGINGQTNPADFSCCWMLYTSDTELSNAAWGTVSVDGVTYQSAAFGAEALPVADGTYYVWQYRKF